MDATFQVSLCRYKAVPRSDMPAFALGELLLHLQVKCV